MKRILIISLFLCLGVFTKANDFKQKALLDTVHETGFYKIMLSPDIISGLNDTYSDLRIYDQKNREVPYLLFKENFYYKSVYFREFPILENTTGDNSKRAKLILQNPDKALRSEIRLIIRNTDAEKEITLKGSDDKRTWYIITKGYPERLAGNSNDSSETRVLDFPPSNFGFFELSMPTKKHELFQVIKAGFIDEKMAKGAYIPLPKPKMLQKDSLTKSYITLIFEKPYEINCLEWEISWPEFFLRQCNIGKKKYNPYPHFELLHSNELSSKKSLVWQFETIKTDTLTIIIENNNNLPLKIKSIKAFQLNIVAIAQLEGNNTYTLLFDNHTILKPDYDLKYFTDKIPQKLPEIQCSKPLSIAGNTIDNTKEKNHSILLNKSFLWTILIIVAFGLLLLTIKLLKEMK
jgi:hypothetical protein